MSVITALEGAMAELSALVGIRVGTPIAAVMTALVRRPTRGRIRRSKSFRGRLSLRKSSPRGHRRFRHGGFSSRQLSINVPASGDHGPLSK